MIIEEMLSETLVKHYSDKGFQLLQKETGYLYPEPIDAVPCKFTYEETDIPIEEEEDQDERIGEEDSGA